MINNFLSAKTGQSYSTPLKRKLKKRQKSLKLKLKEKKITLFKNILIFNFDKKNTSSFTFFFLYLSFFSSKYIMRDENSGNLLQQLNDQRYLVFVSVK